MRDGVITVKLMARPPYLIYLLIILGIGAIVVLSDRELLYSVVMIGGIIYLLITFLMPHSYRLTFRGMSSL